MRHRWPPALKYAIYIAMPLPAKIAVGSTITLLVGGAVFLIAMRGPAIILDMAVNAAAFICL